MIRLIFLLVILCPSLSFGALVLTVDMFGKTYNLTGSTSGTPTNSGGFGEAFFSLPGTGSSISSDSINDSSVLNVDSGFFIGATLFVTDDGGVNFNLNTSETGALTLTGTGTTVSYATFTPALENAIGSSLSLSSGSGFEPIAVQVPEPATFGFVTALFALTFIFCRRRR